MFPTHKRNTICDIPVVVQCNRMKNIILFFYL